MLEYCWLDPLEQTSVKFKSEFKIFIQENAHENVVWEMVSICLGLNVLTHCRGHCKWHHLYHFQRADTPRLPIFTIRVVHTAQRSLGLELWSAQKKKSCSVGFYISLDASHNMSEQGQNDRNGIGSIPSRLRYIMASLQCFNDRNRSILCRILLSLLITKFAGKASALKEFCYYHTYHYVIINRVGDVHYTMAQGW